MRHSTAIGAGWGLDMKSDVFPVRCQTFLRGPRPGATGARPGVAIDDFGTSQESTNRGIVALFSLFCPILDTSMSTFPRKATSDHQHAERAARLPIYEPKISHDLVRPFPPRLSVPFMYDFMPNKRSGIAED